LSGLVDEQPILELEQHSQSSIHDTVEAIPTEEVEKNTPIESASDKSDNTSPIRPSSPQHQTIVDTTLSSSLSSSKGDNSSQIPHHIRLVLCENSLYNMSGETIHGGNANRTFTTPIVIDTTVSAPMKNISPAVLPTFRGLSLGDPDQFLFEFKLLCRTYDYEHDNQKLKLFPSTLKDNALRWFIGLAVDSITSWADMEKVFLDKYQEYCKVKDRKDKLFQIKQGDDESLEDYLDRFLFV